VIRILTSTSEHKIHNIVLENFELNKRSRIFATVQKSPRSNHAQMAVQHIQTVEEFETLLKNNTFVVADFFADWCPPCKAIAPMFGGLATANSRPGHLAFVKINVDNSPDLAGKYGIRAMPTFLFFDKGKPYPGTHEIRGAGNIRGIQAIVNAMASAAPTAKSDAESTAKPVDESTVSGGYTMGGGSGKRPDWKMSLTG